jgi:hypothetical protein
LRRKTTPVSAIPVAEISPAGTPGDEADMLQMDTAGTPRYVYYHERFKDISGAYENLSDPQKSARYDNGDHIDMSDMLGGGGTGGIDPEVLISMMGGGGGFGGGVGFGGGLSGGGGRQRAPGASLRQITRTLLKRTVRWSWGVSAHSIAGLWVKSARALMSRPVVGHRTLSACSQSWTIKFGRRSNRIFIHLGFPSWRRCGSDQRPLRPSTGSTVRGDTHTCSIWILFRGTTCAISCIPSLCYREA